MNYSRSFSLRPTTTTACLNIVFNVEDEGSGGDEGDLADAKQRYEVPEGVGNGVGGETFDLIIDEGKSDQVGVEFCMLVTVTILIALSLSGRVAGSCLADVVGDGVGGSVV